MNLPTFFLLASFPVFFTHVRCFFLIPSSRCRTLEKSENASWLRALKSFFSVVIASRPLVGLRQR